MDFIFTERITNAFTFTTCIIHCIEFMNIIFGIQYQVDSKDCWWINLFLSILFLQFFFIIIHIKRSKNGFLFSIALFNNNKPINWILQYLHKYAKNNNRNENISFIPTFSIRQYFFFSQSTEFKSSDFRHIIFVLSPKTFIWSICFILRLISIEMLKAKVTVVSVCCFIYHNANCKAIIYFDIKFWIHVFYLK